MSSHQDKITNEVRVDRQRSVEVIDQVLANYQPLIELAAQLARLPKAPANMLASSAVALCIALALYLNGMLAMQWAFGVFFVTLAGVHFLMNQSRRRFNENLTNYVPSARDLANALPAGADVRISDEEMRRINGALSFYDRRELFYMQGDPLPEALLISEVLELRYRILRFVQS